ncbi:MAG: alanine racemase [Clostridia bacterium]|nr:alanine racemase [Clostridia bacterium]
MNDVQGLRRRTWAEVDLNRIRHNYRAVREAVPEQTKICCVIKADAYGHGAVALAALYEKLGADWFAVSNLEEALQLRHHQITLPILILGYTPEECAPLLAKHRISQCVYSRDYGFKLAREARKAGVRIRIHIKLDTGMGRIGFLSRGEDSLEWADALAVCQEDFLIPEGIFTHCAVADGGESGDEYTDRQFQCFMEGVSYLENAGVKFSIRHFANSAVIFDHPKYHLDMVRAGIVLYGLMPSGQMRRLPKLLPAMSWKSVISHCKLLHPGDTVSYGRTFIADREMRIATVPVGYADGFWRINQQNNGCLSVHGQSAPIVGRICMDQLMLDVTEIPCEIGDVVTIFGTDGKEAEELAEKNDTIGYEILCSVGTRVPRLYREEGIFCGYMDYIYPEDL